MTKAKDNSVIIGSTTIMTKAAVNRKVASIKKTGDKLDKDIHTVAVSAMFHAMSHGDTTLMTNVATNMPRSVRGKALVSWMTKHAPVTWDNASNSIKIKKGWESADFDIDTAEATPFFVVKEVAEKEVKAYDMAAFIEDISKVANNKKGKRYNVNDEVVAKANEILEMINPTK